MASWAWERRRIIAGEEREIGAADTRVFDRDHCRFRSGFQRWPVLNFYLARGGEGGGLGHFGFFLFLEPIVSFLKISFSTVTASAG